MTRRILAALLALTGGLLIGALLPLGFEMDHELWRDYGADTLAVAHTASSAAEETVVDHESTAELKATLKSLRREDEGGRGLTLAVVDDSGHLLPGASPGLYTPARAAPGLRGDSRVIRVDGAMVAVVPIVGHDDQTAGAVLLARPTDPVEDRVRRLWLRLAMAAGLAIVAAVVLATALARWVGRPLRRLENAAEALGSGELGARAEPPKRPAEVRQVAERFNVMAARLETLIYDHRAVIADVSHQLRTPLAALRLRMELLAADAVPAAEPEFEGALEELARLSRLVDGLLAVARAENTSSAPEPVVLGSVVNERVEAWRPVAAERGVELSVRVHGDPVALLGPGHLEQVLDNLIDNALTAEPANVRLIATSGRAGVRLSVVDDGAGMTEQDMAEAFRRYRTDRATGTGLGLAIVHRLVTADGGEIGLSATSGGGLTVTLDLQGSRTRQPLQ